MKEWFEQLEARERWALIAGAVALVLAGFYFLLWRPQVSARDDLVQTVRAQRAALEWMQNAAGEVTELRRAGAGPMRRSGSRSLLGVVDRTARSVALSQYVTRMEPQGDDRVRLWFTRAPFDELVEWLSTLETRYGIRVITTNLERDKESGYVGGRMALGYTEAL